MELGNYGIILEIFGFLLFLPQSRNAILELDYPLALYRKWKSTNIHYNKKDVIENMVRQKPDWKRQTKKEFIITSTKRQIMGIMFDIGEWHPLIRGGRKISIKQYLNEIFKFGAIGLIVIGLTWQFTE